MWSLGLNLGPCTCQLCIQLLNNTARLFMWSQPQSRGSSHLPCGQGWFWSSGPPSSSSQGWECLWASSCLTSVVLRIKPRALCILGKHPTAEPHYQPTLLTFDLQWGLFLFLVSVYGIIHIKEVIYPIVFLQVFLPFFFFFFTFRQGLTLCSSGWPGIQYIAQASPTGLIFLTLSLK